MKENKITRQMGIEEIFTRFPQKTEELADALANAGVRCFGCAAAAWESLEAGFKAHGMSDQEIDALVEHLNQIVAD